MNIPLGASIVGGTMTKSARLMASGKQGLFNLFEEHIMPVSVVAADKIEKMMESPSFFITRGQQMVASPIVAVSRGTGTIYRIYPSVSFKYQNQ